ncbi:MAG: type IV secretion system protein, partial [Pseudomonadota bacterium]
FSIGGKFLNSLSFWNLGKSIRNIFIGIAIMIIGFIFVAAAAVVIMVGKIGFAMSMSLAPLAIGMLIMPQTRGHFESWMRFMLGFAVIPLLISALMAVVLFAAAKLLPASGLDDNLGIYVSFLVIMIGALALLFQIPTLASTLASASVAAIGAGVVMAAARMGMSAATGGASRVMEGAKTASQAAKAGANPVQAIRTGIHSMRQSAHARASRRDERIAKKMHTSSSGTPAPNRAEARNANAPTRGSGNNGRLSAEQMNRYRSK